jgi:hypothetical protein
VEGNRIPKRVEVREDGRIIGGEGWQEKVYNREELKKLLKTARNCHILHVPKARMNRKQIYYLCCLSVECLSVYFESA